MTISRCRPAHLHVVSGHVAEERHDRVAAGIVLCLDVGGRGFERSASASEYVNLPAGVEASLEEVEVPRQEVSEVRAGRPGGAAAGGRVWPRDRWICAEAGRAGLLPPFFPERPPKPPTPAVLLIWV